MDYLNYLTPVGKIASLVYSAKSGNSKTVQALIDMGVNVNTENHFGDTALGAAAQFGQTAIVDLLLHNGANINAADSAENTPLIYATCNDNNATVNLLIKAKANLCTRNKDNNTALSIAVQKNYIEIVFQLLSAMSIEQVTQEIYDHPNIQKHFDDFKKVVVQHRYDLFEIFGPLALNESGNSLFSTLPFELTGLIASKYGEIKNQDTWHALHSNIDSMSLCNAFNNLSFTPSFTAQPESKIKIEDEKSDDAKLFLSSYRP